VIQRAVGVVVALLVALWLVAPAQTEALVKGMVGLVTHRITQSDTSTPAPKGHAAGRQAYAQLVPVVAAGGPRPMF
jgi:hypothetical protein